MKLLYLHNIPLDSEKANITSVLFLCDSFKRMGIDVTLAVPESNRLRTKESITFFVEEYIGRSFLFDIVTYPKITAFGKLNILGSYFGAKKIMKYSQADICYCRIPMFVYLSMKYSIPVVFESHNALLHTKYKVLDAIWRKILIQYSKTDMLVKFITISQALADYWIEKGIDTPKIIALHDGFDSRSFENSLTQKAARENLGLKNDRKIVIYAGSLYPDRGIEDIIKLAQAFPDVEYIVVGGPSNQKILFEDDVRRKGIKNISFTGWIPQSQVKNFLYAADVLLMTWSKKVPTIDYCSPLKMFEYMASGRIIVGHGFPTIREVLVDGESAYLVEPDSFEDLVMKLRKALDDTYPSKIAENAQRLAFRNYSWEKRAEEIINHINL